jgi:hypothetical protein
MRFLFLLSLPLALAPIACSSSDSGPQQTGADSTPSDTIVSGGDSDHVGDSNTGTDTNVTPDSPSDTTTETGGGLISQISGQWHGKIGAGYKNGCLCLTLDTNGKVIAPSGITMGFGVTSGGGTTDTTIVDPVGRIVTIHMLVTGAGFSIKNATVAPDASTMSGQWAGDSPSPFDDTIDLDRLPQTCKDRTGLDGAPC